MTPEDRRKLIEKPWPRVRIVPNAHGGVSRGPAKKMVRDYGNVRGVSDE